MNTLFMVSTLVLSGGQVLFGLCTVATLILGGVILTKKYFSIQSAKLLNQEHAGNSSTLVRKHDAVDIMNHQTSFKLVGLAASLAFIFIIFAWTTCDINATLAAFVGEPETIEMEAPVTTQKEPQLPPALPPPPAPTPTTDFLIDDTTPEPSPNENPDLVESPTPSDYTGPTDKKATTFIPTYVEPVIEEPVKEEEIEFIIVEQMPRFPGCEDVVGDNNAKKACADKKLLSFIYDNIRYPDSAIELDIEGMVSLNFVVDKDGSINDIQIVKEPGGGCGREAQRVVKLMNNLPQKWTPGKQRGKNVKVRYNLPIKFKLH